MKKVLKILGKILLCIILLAAIGITVLTITEYKPAAKETVIASHEAEAKFETGKTLSILSWNCGYGALGDNADFFMDGGKAVNPSSKARVRTNLESIRDEIAKQKTDFVLLQEVDINSGRSYGTDERKILKEGMPGAEEAFAYNFKALYVPYPIPPIGHVESGLYTLSSVPVRSAERISLPCPFKWPIRTVHLKRCLLVSHIPLEGTDKELVLINLHLEAYDDGAGKEAQTQQLISVMEEEAERGNYVIAGGDFNQLFSNVDSSAYPVYEGKWQPGRIEAEAFGDSFTLLMDPSAPTCRSLDRKYEGEDADTFQFYMIDGFILSNNVQADSIKTLSLGFTATDHNPVRLECTLLPAN